jgi:hypothetical protein
MTIRMIQRSLAANGKRVKMRQLRQYIKDCGIQHLGIRQRPQQYPDNAAEIIMSHLGLNGKRVAA